jgi:hypothetical protein
MIGANGGIHGKTVRKVVNVVVHHLGSFHGQLMLANGPIDHHSR